MSQEPPLDKGLKPPGKRLSQDKVVDKDFSHEGKVIIKSDAYITMISHVLRFGSEGLEKNVEVLGVCIGKKAEKGKNLICYEAVPINHGSSIDIEFNDLDYKKFASIDEEANKKNMSIIGWYHSHPRLGLIFTNTDIKNHLFWQKEGTPDAFAVVFDHSQMGKNDSLGFKSFRLDNYKLGEKSDYHEIVVEVEPPESLDFFKIIKNLVEESQKESPILIKEYDEIGDLQEIPKPTEGEIVEMKEESPLKPTIDGFVKGTQELKDNFLPTFQDKINKWTHDITVGTSKSSAFIANTISTMQNSIDLGIKKVEEWFEKTLSTQMEEFKLEIKNQVQERLDSEIELTKEINDNIDLIVEDIVKIINENISQKINEIGEKIKQNSKIFEDLEKIQEKISQDVNKQTEIVNNTNENTEKTISGINQKVNTISTKFNEILNEEINNISDKLSVTKEQTEKLASQLETLQKSIKKVKKI